MERTWLLTLILVPLIGFALFRRHKGTFGKQRLAPRRMVVRMVLLSVVCTLLVTMSPPPPAGLIAAASGVVVGALLAAVGLRLTTFETTSDGKFYTPNGWIGLGVTALLLGRLAARLVTLPERMAAVHDRASPIQAMQRTPLTLGLFFLLGAYYVSYYGSVLLRASKLSPSIKPPS
jgi:hypothetical protein